jgi:hypothetical protein
LARSPGRRLKVFQARLGFYDSVVAAANQAAALRAWGVRQNLFADGQAQIATDPQAVQAALAQPETPLQRPVGSSDPFEINPANLPTVPDAPKRPAIKAAPKPAKARPSPPPADRSTLDKAEKALRVLDEGRKAEEAALRQREDELEAERAQAQHAYVGARKAATAAVVASREAYRKAGGEG